jgi:hypothetical protein
MATNAANLQFFDSKVGGRIHFVMHSDADQPNMNMNGVL